MYNKSRLKITAISVHSSVTELLHLTVLDNRDCVVKSGLLHLGHLLPLSVDGVELQDFIRVGAGTVTVPTA